MRQLSNAEVADYLNHGKQPDLTAPGGSDPVVETGYVLTTTTSVNVRASASQDARTLGQIPDAGTAFPLLGTVTSGGRLWYRISYLNQEGYLLSSVARMMSQQEYLDYINNLPSPSPTPAPTPVPPAEEMSQTAITNIRNVIIRWPAQHVTVVILSNRNHFKPYPLALTIGQLFTACCQKAAARI